MREPLPPPAAGEHRSLALGFLLQELRSRERWEILDLGPASGRTVQFLSAFRCRLHIADLYSDRVAQGLAPGAAPHRFADLCYRRLRLPPAARLDLILAWDLLNYLSEGEMAVLAGCLSRFCRPGALFFCLISIRSQIQAEPMVFSILDPQTLLYQDSTPALRACPRYTEPDLIRALPGFLPQQVFLLRNGMQEYIFEYRPLSAPASAPAPGR